MKRILLLFSKQSMAVYFVTCAMLLTNTSFGQKGDTVVLGQSKQGKAWYGKVDTTFFIKFPDEHTGKYFNFLISDTSSFKRTLLQAFDDHEFKFQLNDVSIINNGNNEITILSPIASLRINRYEYAELFQLKNESEPLVLTSFTTDTTQSATAAVNTQPNQYIGKRGDTVYNTRYSNLTPSTSVIKPMKPVRLMKFYTNLLLSYATNDYLDSLSGHGGGATLSMGIFFKYGFTVGIGGGVFGTYLDQEGEKSLDELLHYPLFGEIQYVGKRGKFAPYASVQAGMVISSIEQIDRVDQNKEATYVAGKLGLSIPMSKKRKSKLLVFGGMSIYNLADINIDKKFLVAGLGFSF